MRRYLGVAPLVGFVSCQDEVSAQHSACSKKRDFIPETQPRSMMEGYTMMYGATPDQWLWNDIDGVNYLTTIKQQHMPNYCGSCWAQAASSSMSDRIKIMRRAAWPEINISPQVLISCEDIHGDAGCHGGDSINAFQWIYENEITDETCSIYQGRGHDNGVQCSSIIQCKTCKPHTDCYIPDEYPIFKASAYDMIKAEDHEAIATEIYQHGPVACGIAVSKQLLEYTGGVLHDTSGLGPDDIDHDISIVGFGVEDGVKFWLVRNSWGHHYGESGFFRIVRGVNMLAIESQCQYIDPIDTWSSSLKHKTKDSERNDPRNADQAKPGPYPSNESSAVKFLEEKPKTGCGIIDPNAVSQGEGPRAYETLDSATLPASWDWRYWKNPEDGKVYNPMSWTTNQHIPTYCGSCWAQASTSSLADRFNIMNIKSKVHIDRAPVALSPQAMVNCVVASSCNGGSANFVFEYALSTGIPHASCLQYVSEDNACTPLNTCRDCVPPIPNTGEDLTSNCKAITDDTVYYAASTSIFDGADAMKKEIFANGPIACGVDATENFLNTYTGGIYSEELDFPSINHFISVLGWGVSDQGEEYWIGRNSWGTFWGEQGFFQIKMHKDNLGIELWCSSAEPSYTKVQPKQETE